MSELEEIMAWKEEARNYAKNADYWRNELSASQAREAELRQEIDITDKLLNKQYELKATYTHTELQKAL